MNADRFDSENPSTMMIHWCMNESIVESKSATPEPAGMCECECECGKDAEDEEDCRF